MTLKYQLEYKIRFDRFGKVPDNNVTVRIPLKNKKHAAVMEPRNVNL